MTMYTQKTANKYLNAITDYVFDTQEPALIQTEKGNMVVMTEEEFRGMAETLYLHSIPGMVEKIIEAKKQPLEECSDTLDW